ncbi:neoverrucotoxin subunit beta-like [Bradysia coprophila]|uniref:neoverrucotoxin subunit beta-like n=1 Tax=Bradysia coprophila TaxID=38358 RepID=UPI00187DC2D1|nr:neoverrucotoxin subunit beta-like [Bradysia coprophila]
MKLSVILFCCVITISSSKELALYSKLGESLQRQINVDPIILAAVGRVATLGELYDARTDQFFRMSLIDGNYSSLIQSTDNKYSNLKYLKLNTLNEKLQNLNVQAGFKLSVLFGLIEVSGSGKFFSDKQQSTRSAKVSVANFVTTQFEKIEISGEAGRKFINQDILKKIDATHVVVGIEWGGNVIVSVEDYNSENKDKQTVQGSLGGKLEMLVGSISVNGEVSIDEQELKQFSQFSFELYGDVLPTELPTTLVEAIVMMKSVPKLLTQGNDGKGKALAYHLLPISVYRQLLSLEAEMNSLVASIDESTINSCVKLFEEIDIIGLKIKDLSIEANNFQNYISKDKMDKVNMFENSYQIYQIELKRRLSEHLILVKSGNETVNQIINILNEAYIHDLSPYNIDFDQFLSMQTEFKFIKLLFDLEVKVLDKSTSINEFMSMNLNKNVYAFFYTVEFPNLADEPMIAFRTILETREEFDSEGIFVAIKFDVLRDIERETYFNFAAPTRLRMYRNGICLIDDYSIYSHPPNESESPLWSLPYIQAQIVQLQTDTIQLKSDTIQLKTDTTQLKSNTTRMEKNPVPIYYTYVQYPDMPEPNQLWPTVTWLEITSRYAGLFFRAVGGSSKCFNCGIQNDMSPRITSVARTNVDQTQQASLSLSYNDNPWTTPWLGSGGTQNGWTSIRFTTQYKEVIPKNKSIRIWERSP